MILHLLWLLQAMDLFNLGEDVGKVQCPVLVSEVLCANSSLLYVTRHIFVK